MADTATMTAAEWLAPGRKTIEGYLSVTRGPRKGRRLGLLDEAIVGLVEEATGREMPRHPDLHAVWFGIDRDKKPGYQLQRPFVRYRAPRPIEGLSRECQMHRVRLTCTVGKTWQNGLGADITRAVGECLECASPGSVGSEGGDEDG